VSDTTAAFELIPQTAFTANDLVFRIRNSAGTELVKVDQEGDATLPSVTATNHVTTSGYLSVSGLGYFRAPLGNDASGVAPLKVGDPDGLQLTDTAALPTCVVGIEGTFKRDGTTGAASTARTRVCLCTSDGAATPAYAWVNAVSGTVGTATTCAP